MLNDFKLAEIETKFANIIWDNEPMNSTELVKVAERELQWKKSTTYSILKKLCERGIFKNENATVSAVIKRDEFYSRQSQKYVDDTFDGSLPKFLTAFISNKNLTVKQINEAKRLIDEYVVDEENKDD
jgi:predicted transcriptional regulator